MVRVVKKPLIVPAVVALLALALVAIVARPAHAASQFRYVNGATSTTPLLWIPQPFPSTAIFGPSETPTMCIAASSSVPQADAFFTFPNFSIPGTDVITGVEVVADYVTAGDQRIRLTDGGALTGTEKVMPANPPVGVGCDSATEESIGGSSDLWGRTFTPADFNGGNIGVWFKQKAITSGSGDPSTIPIDIDAIRLVVHHGPANSPPVADAGGPYMVNEGSSVGLSGAGSSDPNQSTASLTFDWDLDNDGAFDDATGISPTFSAAGRNGPDSQTIRLRVTDNGSLTSIDTATVTIKDVAPTITAVNAVPTSIDEAQSVTVSGTFSDPALALETYTGSASWSDGATSSVSIGSGTFTTSRTFPDDHPSTGTASDGFTVQITVKDTATLAADTEPSPTITVNNVDPAIVAVNLSAASIDEGDSVTVSGSFTDPALGVGTETFTGSSLWSDLAVTTVTVGAGTFSTSRTFVDDNPTGTPSDTFDVDVTINDDDLGSDTGTSATLTVNNVDPVITSLSVTPMIDEDGTVSLNGSFTDVGVADTHTVSVDWGEGPLEAATVVQGAGSGTFSASHQYLDDDPTATPQDTYTITVTVTDDDTGSDTATVGTLVKNVAPVIDAIASDATFADKAEEGEPVTVSGTFSDVGTLDTHTGSVDWGDGTVTPATIGAGTFTASHAYAAGGVYTVEVTITDDDTGEVSDTTTAVVTGVGVNGGVLQIVGTAGDDHVEVQRVNAEIDVFADFVTPHHRRFDASLVASIEMWLCEGNDHGDVHPLVTLDATIHGDAGDDMLWGGSGNDVIEGGDGSDMLWGRNGDDLLDGGPGIDKLFGGKGSNILIN